MNSIVAVSHEGDPHVEAVLRYALPEKYLYIKTDKLHKLSLIESKSDSWLLHFQNKVIEGPNISFWYRKPEFIEFSDNKSNSPEEIKKIKLAFEYKKKTILTVLQYTSFLAASRGWFYLNDPVKMFIAKNKLNQLCIAKELGFTIPHSIVTNNISEVKSFLKTHKQCIIKPLIANTKYGDLLINFNTNRITLEHLQSIDKIDYPVFIQEEIQRKYELRITLVGNKLYPCAIEIDSTEKDVDIRTRTTSLPHKIITVPANIEKKCFELSKKLGLNFAAFDIAYTPEGKYVFFEINPNGQYLWIEEKTGAPISERIARLLTNPSKYRIV